MAPRSATRGGTVARARTPTSTTPAAARTSTPSMIAIDRGQRDCGTAGFFAARPRRAEDIEPAPNLGQIAYRVVQAFRPASVRLKPGQLRVRRKRHHTEKRSNGDESAVQTDSPFLCVSV